MLGHTGSGKSFTLDALTELTRDRAPQPRPEAQHLRHVGGGASAGEEGAVPESHEGLMPFFGPDAAGCAQAALRALEAGVPDEQRALAGRPPLPACQLRGCGCGLGSRPAPPPAQRLRSPSLAAQRSWGRVTRRRGNA